MKLLLRSIIGAILLVMMVLLGTFSFGCAPSRPKPSKYNEVLDSETVVMLDTWVTTRLSRQKEWIENHNGFIEPHVILRNNSGDIVSVEFRTYFKDQYGGTVRTSIDTWVPVTINPHEDYHYQKMCTKKEGIKYQIHVRLGKNKR